MILEADHITFYYRRKDVPVLKDISLSVSSGERVGLKAPSGRGKTTLCRLLAGYERPVKGQVLLDGKLLKDYRGICPVQMVWQHPETVVDPLLRLKTTLNEAGHVEQRLLDHLHIEEEWLDRYPSELSGGELQRVLLAMAIDPLPDLLILDEPVSGVDINGLDMFYKKVSELRHKYHMAILLVSHDLSLIKSYADRIVLMDRTVIAQGSPEEVYKTKAFLDIFGYTLKEAEKDGIDI